ncbi:MAG: hypothetical protein JWP89_4668 [Schlesneria sp.]|nr:hypothetical protein [Schlesneria sp.]
MESDISLWTTIPNVRYPIQVAEPNIWVIENKKWEIPFRIPTLILSVASAVLLVRRIRKR